MRRLVLTACALLAAAALPGTAAPSGGAIAKLPQITSFELANGLKVAVLRTEAAPIVSVQLWVRAGSKDEPRDRRGVATMVEKLMFDGSQHVRTGAHQQLIASLGGYTTSVTDEDATAFVDTLPSEQVDFAIRLEAERLRGLLLLPELVASEREVAKEYARQAEGNALTKGFLRLFAAAFTKHPYAWTAVGNGKELDATTPADVKKFYDTYYQPNNAMLVVVGRVTADEVKASVEKYFGAIPKAADVPHAAAALAEPAQTATRKETVDGGQVGLALVGFHVPAASDPDVAAVQVAAIVLGGGESSRLKAGLRAPDPTTKQAPAKDGGLQMFVRQDPSLAIAWGLYLDPTGADAVVAAIAREAQTLARTGPTKDELRKAKNQVQSAFVFSLEKAEGLADAMGRSWIQTGDPGAFLHEVDRVEAVTAADVKRVAAKYLSLDTATVVIVPPLTGGK